MTVLLSPLLILSFFSLPSPFKFSWLKSNPTSLSSLSLLSSPFPLPRSLSYISLVCSLTWKRLLCLVGYEATMLSSEAIGKLWTNGEPKALLQTSLGSTSHANIKRSNVTFQNSSESCYVQKLHTFSSFRNYPSRTRSHHLWRTLKQEIPKGWLCRLHIYASSDEDYRSSRNIAISLFKRYRNVIDRGGGDNLKEFINAGVNAYALGCTDEGLREELMDMKNSGIEIEGLETYGGGTGLRFKILSEEVHECILWLSIVFITILCTPQPTVVRWSSTPPVSTEIMLQWKGFCALIANAYYTRGMAWLPVKTLQLEQMAVMGSAEEPSVVASRMRLVFSTLEVVSPQWPRV